MNKKGWYLFMLAIATTTLSVTRKATFAGGCFWCMEAPFEKLDGIVDVVSGYMGGSGKNPTYRSYAKKGYVEVVEIAYDPKKITYNQLLNVFWRQINPTDAGGQFGDRGPQYRSIIFYHNDTQQKIAELSKGRLEKSGRFSQPIVTEISPAQPFYKAEKYHQNYYKKHPWKYALFRYQSGRDAFLKKTWTKRERQMPKATYIKPSDQELRKRLTPLQYRVTQQNATEKAYDNKYWDNKKPGIYVDIVSGEPLFSSLDQFDSQTGWPAFSQSLEPNNIITRPDRGWFTTRTEVRSRHANSHLGHLFKHPNSPTGIHYCINSAALRFIPAMDLEQLGYGKYASLFD